MSRKEITRAEAESMMKLGVTGAIGKQYVIRNTPWGKVLSKYPKLSTAPPTKKQQIVREKFKQAISRAKEMLLDPDIVATYQKTVSNGESVFNKLVSDCFKEVRPGRKKWWKWSKG